MEHAKKMEMVSKDLFDKMMVGKSVSAIDKEMQKVLRSADPPDVKLKLYQQALGKFLQEHEKLREPMEVRIKGDKPKAATEAAILGGVSQRYKPVAEQLLAHLNRTNRFKWKTKLPSMESGYLRLMYLI
jgi:hypothetical protein